MMTVLPGSVLASMDNCGDSCLIYCLSFVAVLIIISNNLVFTRRISCILCIPVDYLLSNFHQISTLSHLISYHQYMFTVTFGNAIVPECSLFVTGSIQQKELTIVRNFLA